MPCLPPCTSDLYQGEDSLYYAQPWHPLIQCPQPGVILPHTYPPGILGMSVGIFGCHSQEVLWTSSGEGQECCQHPIMCRTPHHPDLSSPKYGSAEAEKAYSNLRRKYRPGE